MQNCNHSQHRPSARQYESVSLSIDKLFWSVRRLHNSCHQSKVSWATISLASLSWCSNGICLSVVNTQGTFFHRKVCFSTPGRWVYDFCLTISNQYPGSNWASPKASKCHFKLHKRSLDLPNISQKPLSDFTSVGILSSQAQRSLSDKSVRQYQNGHLVSLSGDPKPSIDCRSV